MLFNEKESISRLKDYATRILKLCESYERTGEIDKELLYDADPRISYMKEESLIILKHIILDLLRLKFLKYDEEMGKYLIERYIDDLSEIIPYKEYETVSSFIERNMDDIYEKSVKSFGKKHGIEIIPECFIKFEEFGILGVNDLLERINVNEK